MKIHPKRFLLADLTKGLAPGSRPFMVHALKCAACREELLNALETEPDSPSSVLSWDRPFDSYLPEPSSDLQPARARLARAEAEAGKLVDELLAETAGRRALLLDSQPRFWTWQVAERLVDTMRETSVKSPEEAERLAGLALGLIGRLSEPPYRGRRGDLLARTWAGLGNARRVGFDLAGAERAFAAARACLRQGSRDALERALVNDLEASLAIDQRRFADAHRLLSRATAVYREYGELHRAGRARVKMATVYTKSGEAERAIPLLREALSFIEPGREPRLEFAVRHNLASALADAGQVLEAQKIFASSREHYRRFPEPWAENRRLWLTGKLARLRGETAEAEAAFLAARDGFLADGIPYATVLVTLELAALYAELGRTAELSRLAAQSAHILLSRQIHREALLALAFFRQAVEAEAAHPEIAQGVIARVATYLKKAQDDPHLRFEG